MAQCINCNIAIRDRQQYRYVAISMSPELISILEEWTTQEVTTQDYICEECLNLLLVELSNRNEGNTGHRQLGHQSVCVCCGVSLLRQSGRRKHPLREGQRERDFIARVIEPRQLPTDALACAACWLRVRSNMQHVMEPLRDVKDFLQDNVVECGSSSVIEPVSMPSLDFDVPIVEHSGNKYLKLNGYSRTPDTSNHCFVADCENRERLRIPLYLRQNILIDYKLYITSNARVCEEHASVYNWEFLEEHVYTEQFSLPHIVEMLDLLRKKVDNTIDFESVENMNDRVCRYWTGLSVLNFLAILTVVQTNLSAMCRKPKTALGVYLMKIRTGEPIRRIASLLYMNKSIACIYLRKARNCLKELYVPLHLGTNHISRAGHSSRNLLIPQGLFSTAASNLITIFDGSYLYLQKSSNYLFQKKSTQKYADLVKPFLLVATDGHIIDIFGPYSATTSDATIVQWLFQNENSELREYFRQNDIFISLDQGFRDAVPLLTSLGYSIYKPENRESGESQLSTDKANRSRLVTLSRWVVEVVNGRFRRDFKIFREKYLNIASKNLMDDFKIAGAIINQFYPVLIDHPDAQSILDRARQAIE